MKRLIHFAGILALLCTSFTPGHCNQLTIKITGNSGAPTSLPPTNLDSFVAQSGYNSQIYGDEGTDNVPPIFGFTSTSRINAGINSVNDAGLTTGHGSWMPSAWGADEYLAAPGEWAMTGAGSNGNNNDSSGGIATLNATDVQSQYVIQAYSEYEAWATAQFMASAQQQIDNSDSTQGSGQSSQSSPIGDIMDGVMGLGGSSMGDSGSD